MVWGYHCVYNLSSLLMCDICLCLLPTCILHTPVFCPHSFSVCLFSSWCWFVCVCSSCALCVLAIVPLHKACIFHCMFWTAEKIQFSFIKNITIIYCNVLGYSQNRGRQLSLSQHISGLFNLCFSAQTQTSHIHYLHKLLMRLYVWKILKSVKW